MKTNNISIIILGLLTALGLSCMGYFISQTMYNAKMAINTAQVKGLAEVQVKANSSSWRLSLSVMGSDKLKIPELYQKINSELKQVEDILLSNGLSKEEIEVGIINNSVREFRDDKQVLVERKYVLTANVNVETEKVGKIKEVRKKMNILITKGFNLTSHAPSYKFTNLNKIKPDLLKEATQNARASAAEFAKNAGVEVGKIKSARQGNISITDIGSDYSDSKKIDKKVRVVTTITFYLK